MRPNSGLPGKAIELAGVASTLGGVVFVALAALDGLDIALGGAGTRDNINPVILLAIGVSATGAGLLVRRFSRNR